MPPHLPLLASQKQFQIEQLAKDADLVQINHPLRTPTLSKRQLERLSGYKLIELDSGKSTENEYWDTALSAGRYSFGVANDDLHYPDKSYRIAVRCNFLCTPSARYEDILQTLNEGCFYSMRIPDYGSGDWSVKREKNSTLPYIKEIGLDNETIYIVLSEVAKRIEVIGQDRKLLAECNNCDRIAYTMTNADTYARATAYISESEVKYNNRQISVRLGAMVDENERAELESRLMDDIHGKVCEVVFDDDLDWYYRGRATVEIGEQKSWRIDVLLAFDAEPYKMSVDETNVEMDTGNLPSTSTIEIGENIRGKDSIYSDFVFGTAGDGYNLTGWTELTLRWTANSKTSGTPYVQVVDCEGHVYHTTAGSVDYTVGAYTILLSTLTSASVDISKIRRVFMSGIGQCTLWASGSNRKVVLIYNERKTVVPTITVGGTNAVTIYLNGKPHTYAAGVHDDPDFQLTAGRNDVVVYGGDGSTTQKINLAYRMGRL